MLNSKIYEIIRWTIAIALPALGVLVVSLDSIWSLGLPAQEISLTLDAIGLFLGAIFGINKVIYDQEAEK